MDALLGAARHGDIGELFPSDNPAYLGADSLVLLAGVRDLLKQDGWLVEDIDCVIIAQRPHLAPYRQHMRQNIAGVLEMNPANVGIKATTSDYLGFEGREEGISAYAMALLRHPDSHKQ
jgi:2-C-methyl-D-erythritol 2,4-cyclodiphosphate synthase